MALSALLKVDGKHERLRRLFISKLLRPGIVAVHKPPGAQEASAWWVLGSFEFGAIGVPVSLKKKRGLKVAIPDWSRDPPWEHLLADDWTYWNGFAVRAVPPTEACLEYGLDGAIWARVPGRHHGSARRIGPSARHVVVCAGGVLWVHSRGLSHRSKAQCLIGLYVLLSCHFVHF